MSNVFKSKLFNFSVKEVNCDCKGINKSNNLTADQLNKSADTYYVVSNQQTLTMLYHGHVYKIVQYICNKQNTKVILIII